MKNTLVKAFVHCIKARPHPRRERILAVTTTALGDALWATPAIESLRKSFPDSFIGCLTSPVGMQILKHNPNIDRLYELKEPVLPKFFRLRKELLAEEFDTILLFHASQRLTLPLCASIGASRIVGTAGINKGLDSLLTDPLPKIWEHEITRRLKMVEQIGGKIFSETLSFFLQDVERLPKKEGIWVALHPGSKDAFRRWPMENFAAVGRALQDELRCNILITGSKNEEELMRKTASMIPGAIVADPFLSLRGFAAELERMDLLITNDTGPFHLGVALNTPAIGIYGASSPALFGSHLAKNARTIAKKLPCTPCLKRKCKAPFCNLQIGSCEVIEAAIKMLQCQQS